MNTLIYLDRLGIKKNQSMEIFLFWLQFRTPKLRSAPLMKNETGFPPR